MGEYQDNILDGLATANQRMSRYDGQECKSVAALIVSEGDMSVYKRGKTPTSNTGLTHYVDYPDLSKILSGLTAITIVESFKTHGQVLVRGEESVVVYGETQNHN